MREAVLLTDDDGHITYVCPTVHFFFGYDAKDVTDMGSVETLFGENLIDPGGLESPGEIRNIEATVTDHEGNEHIVLVTVRQVDIEDGTRLYSIRDITERKEHQRILEHREQILRSTYEIIADTDRSVSEKIDALLAMGRDLVGTDYATFSQIDGDQYEFEAIATAPDVDLEAGETTALTELPICERVFQSGRPLVLDDVEVEAPELVDPAWGIACYLGAPVVVNDEAYGTFCFYDVEPQTEGFSDWEQTFVELLGDWVSSELTRERAHDRLQRQNERLDEFASVVSHDLGNPLEVADGQLELAREHCDGDHLDSAATAVDRSRSLIDDLPELARVGEQASDIESVDLAKIADRCWRPVEAGDATLVNEADRTVRADPGRFKQLLENLIGHAVEQGGEEVTVTIGDLDDGFYIADDGPGIPDNQHDQVFDAGYSTADEGTGFGLNIVKQIVEAHGGEVAVTESEDGGARFEVTDDTFAAE